MMEAASNFGEVLERGGQWGIEADGIMDTYSLLFDAAKDVREKEVPGLICEIGVRLGFGIFTMMCGAGSNRTYIGIDPYGQIEMWLATTGNRGSNTDYTNSMKNKFLKNIYAYCDEADINFSLHCLEDVEFFKRFADGVPVYDQIKTIENNYAVVHVDGPHDGHTVLETTKFFEPRLSNGGYISYDNWDAYDHVPIDKYLSKRSIVHVGVVGHKKLYQRQG